MATRKKNPPKISYLEEVSPRVKKRAEDFESVIQDLGKRLSSLEKKIHSNIESLQKGLSTKKSNGTQAEEELQKQIEAIKKGLEGQINEISSAVEKNLKVKLPKKQSVSMWDKLTGWVPDFKRLLPLRDPQKEFEELWNEEIDPFGRDPAFEEKVKPIFDFLFHKYWRIQTHGVENIPSNGRALLVSNHSGTLAYDGSMIRMAVSTDHPSERDVRFLVEDFVYYLPFIGSYMYRLGGVRASRDNAEQLLKTDHLVAVFPEGVKGIGKYFSERYHLQRFGRGGFIKLAIRTKSPIIPVAVIGAEEIHPILYKSSLLAKPLGIPYLPITPTLPLLGPLGFLPLPSKWSIYFGEPIDLSEYGEETLKDELKIHKLSEMVRSTIQGMVTEGLKRRRSIWFG